VSSSVFAQRSAVQRSAASSKQLSASSGHPYAAQPQLPDTTRNLSRVHSCGTATGRAGQVHSGSHLQIAVIHSTAHHITHPTSHRAPAIRLPGGLRLLSLTLFVLGARHRVSDTPVHNFIITARRSAHPARSSATPLTPIHRRPTHGTRHSRTHVSAAATRKRAVGRLRDHHVYVIYGPTQCRIRVTRIIIHARRSHRRQGPHRASLGLVERPVAKMSR
jgi:hypothetical protein